MPIFKLEILALLIAGMIFFLRRDAEAQRVSEILKNAINRISLIFDP